MDKLRSVLACIAFCALAFSPILATGKTWTNNVSGLWNDAASWDPVGVPEVTDDVIIPKAVVTIPTNATVQSLTISGTGFLKVAAQGASADPAVQTPWDASSTNAISLNEEFGLSNMMLQ